MLQWPSAMRGCWPSEVSIAMKRLWLPPKPSGARKVRPTVLLLHITSYCCATLSRSGVRSIQVTLQRLRFDNGMPCSTLIA